MQVVRDAVELGRAARAHAKLKVRQPLREAVVVAADRERGAIERLESLLAEELNVKSVRFVSEADELGRFELKPNYRALGPRFGKQMPQVAAAIAALDPARLRAADARGSTSTARTTRSARTTCRSCSSRSRATRSSARARTPWRSTSSWTTSCAARARARGGARRAGGAQERRPERGGPDRAHARRATRSCSPPPARARGLRGAARRSPRRSTTTARGEAGRRDRGASC